MAKWGIDGVDLGSAAVAMDKSMWQIEDNGTRLSCPRCYAAMLIVNILTAGNASQLVAVASLVAQHYGYDADVECVGCQGIAKIQWPATQTSTLDPPTGKWLTPTLWCDHDLVDNIQGVSKMYCRGQNHLKLHCRKIVVNLDSPTVFLPYTLRRFCGDCQEKGYKNDDPV